MLSGIKTGKRKGSKKRPQQESAPASVSYDHDQSSGNNRKRVAISPRTRTTKNNNNNLDAAALLRAQLTSSSSSSSSSLPSSSSFPQTLTQSIPTIQEKEQDTVVLRGAAALASRNNYAPEDFRNGSRKGKIKQRSVDTMGTTQNDANMSVQDMLKQEKESKQSMDEIYARNIARLGSRYKGTELKSSDTTTDTNKLYDNNHNNNNNNYLTAHATALREKSRQLAQHDKHLSIATKCWWWMQSPSFSNHRIIALGNHVSLIMAPPNLSLFPGHHFYIVPVSHADSLAQCDHHVWDEIRKFQNALRTLYAKNHKDVLFYETVLPSAKGFWQTKMECLPIRASKNDAPMVFRTEMMEQAEEWGTNNKLLKTSATKPLTRTVPPSFPYFYIEFGENHQGYAMILENTNFPKHFGLDTICGMLRMEPMKFRSKNNNHTQDDERQLIQDFLKSWKSVDWTQNMDG